MDNQLHPSFNGVSERMKDKQVHKGALLIRALKNQFITLIYPQTLGKQTLLLICWFNNMLILLQINMENKKKMPSNIHVSGSPDFA